MYVETDFLVALVKDDDCLRDAAVRALEERDDVHTSVLSYAEVLVLFYDREAVTYDIDAPRAIANLLELVPIRPETHEDAVLAAAAFLDEYQLTPFDALHAGLVGRARDACCRANGTTTTWESTGSRWNPTPRTDPAATGPIGTLFTDYR